MKNTLLFFLFLCSGIVIGSLVSELTDSVSWLKWLSFGMSFGITTPFVLDLSVLKITLGASFWLNISTIIFTAIAMYLYYRTVRGRKRR